jgi:hypothetical protein
MDHEMQNCTTNQIRITVDIAISVVVSFLRSIVRFEIIYMLTYLRHFKVTYKHLIEVVQRRAVALSMGIAQ